MAARAKAARYRVTNLGHNPVEVAGRFWPSRRTLTVQLNADEVAVLARHRRLQVEEVKPDPEPEEEK